MTTNAPQIISTMMRDLLGIKVAAKEVEGALGKIRTAAIGLGAVFAGKMILTGVVDLVKHGDKLVEQQVRLRALGVSQSGVDKATRAAEGDALAIRGTDPAHNLEVIRELRGVLKDTQEAIAAAPAVLKAQLVLGQYGVSSGSADTLQMLKAMDIKGGFIKNGRLDVGALDESVKAAEAALTLTNGLLTPGMFYRFTRMAGPAANAMNNEQYLKDMTEVMMGLGSTGGRGLQMAAKTFLGGQLTKANVTQLEALGLINPKDILNDHGHYALKSGSHVAGYDELIAKGFAQWFHDIVQPAMAAHGFTGNAAVMQALGSLPVTEQRLFSFLSTNWPQIQKFGGQYDKAAGTDQWDVLQNGSIVLNIKDLREAWEGLMQVLGKDLAPAAITTLHDLTSGILWFEKEVTLHPNAARYVIELGAALGGLLIVGGTLSIATVALGPFTSALRFLITGLAGAEVKEATTAAATLGGPAGARGSLLSVGLALTTLAMTAGAVWAQAQKMTGDPSKWPKDSPFWNGMPAATQLKYPNSPDSINGVPKPSKPFDWNLNHHAPGYQTGEDPNSPIKNESYIYPSGGNAGAGRPIQFISYTMLDGRVLAKTVSEEQARDMSLPPAGATRFDGRMTAVYPANTMRV